MLKRSLFLALLLLPLLAGAQQTAVRSQAQLDRMADQTPWFSSANAAGLTVRPVLPYNTVDFSWKHEDGALRRYPEGAHVRDLRFDTQGARKVGKVLLWGEFRYDNIADHGSSFNTVLYDPFDERFLYTVADSVASTWKKQAYDMAFKAAIPLAGEALTGGIAVRYTDKIAAKQNDPRSESYHYSVTVQPGFVLKAGTHRIGLNGLYSRTFVRATPTISNSTVIQPVFLLKGLGNFLNDVVGSNGLSTLYFRSEGFGGGLQWGWEDAGTQLLADVQARHDRSRIQESATQPRLQGTTRRLELEGKMTAVWGAGNILTLSGTYAQCTGIEPTTVWNTAEGIWEVRAEIPQCDFRTLRIRTAYDKYIGTDPWLWKVHADLGYDRKDDTYALPKAGFAYSNVHGKLGADRIFPAGQRMSLRVGLRAGAVKNLSGAYLYEGIHPGNAPAATWYPHDWKVLASDRLVQQMTVAWNFPAGKQSHAELSLKLDAAEAEAGARIATVTALSILF